MPKIDLSHYPDYGLLVDPEELKNHLTIYTTHDGYESGRIQLEEREFINLVNYALKIGFIQRWNLKEV